MRARFSSRCRRVAVEASDSALIVIAPNHDTPTRPATLTRHNSGRARQQVLARSRRDSAASSSWKFLNGLPPPGESFWHSPDGTGEA